MKYSKMITIKSDPETMRKANAIAREAKRTRSAYIRDMINVLAEHRHLRQAIVNKLPDPEAEGEE